MSIAMRWVIFAISITLLQFPGAVSATPLTVAVGQDIAQRLTGDIEPPVVWLGGALELETESLPGFYSRRHYAPAWINEFGLTPAADELLEALRDSASHGLCSDDFRLPYIESLVQLERDYLAHGILFDTHYLAILDLLLSDGFFRYAQALSGGADVTATGQHKRKQHLSAALQEHLANNRLAELLKELEPQQQGYVKLRQALAELRDLSAYGGWSQITAGPTLREGNQGERVKQLKIRLFLGGDLDTPAAWDEPGIGALTVAGIRSFQERHGLELDGVVGPLTLAEMNVPIEARIREVEVNLMRLREAPIDFGPRYIRVNIADFTLEVHERDEVVMTMSVVVGTPYRMTPTFSAQLSYLEFAPYWYVPGTILREDKLPLIRRDPGWIERNHYEIVSWQGGPDRRINPLQIDWSKVNTLNFPGMLRMRPGPWNPLGRVKFMFPNRYAVYLHDTNERQLFSRDERLFSSGCIRIERPLDLAQYLLDGIDGWDCEMIVSALEGTETLKVTLPEKIPVYVLYWTAWVDDRQRLQFRRDIYLRDADLIETARASRQELGRPYPGAAPQFTADFSASERQQ
jgi:L,D-transpeptidase YcbB